MKPLSPKLKDPPLHGLEKGGRHTGMGEGVGHV